MQSEAMKATSRPARRLKAWTSAVTAPFDETKTVQSPQVRRRILGRRSWPAAAAGGFACRLSRAAGGFGPPRKDTDKDDTMIVPSRKRNRIFFMASPQPSRTALIVEWSL
jgi:hypothetical protein